MANFCPLVVRALTFVPVLRIEKLGRDKTPEDNDESPNLTGDQGPHVPGGDEVSFLKNIIRRIQHTKDKVADNRDREESEREGSRQNLYPG